MNERIIIDAHAHIFPEKIAEKATKSISDFYSIGKSSKGTVERFLDFNEKLGVSSAIVHSTATTKQQTRPINIFIKSTTDEHKSLIGFGTLHPELSFNELDDEVKFIADNGFKGIKLHPDFQRFNIDGKESENMLSALANEFPVLFHVGDKRYDFSHPEKLITMAKKFPKTIFIAAHFGGYSKWELHKRYQDIPNVMFDTCSSLMFLKIDEAMEIIENLGEDRFMYGTDYPLWQPDEEMERFLALPLSDQQREKIFHLNAEHLLKL